MGKVIHFERQFTSVGPSQRTRDGSRKSSYFHWTIAGTRGDGVVLKEPFALWTEKKAVEALARPPPMTFMGSGAEAAVQANSGCEGLPVALFGQRSTIEAPPTPSPECGPAIQGSSRTCRGSFFKPSVI